MTPILYAKTENDFTSNGVGRLVDCISCTVTEERNGIYECEFTYPITGRYYDTLVNSGGVVSVIHDDTKTRQAFDIYKYSAPINGIVTFNARHISYRLNKIPVKPFTASTCALALQGIGTNSLLTNLFTFWTDKSVSADFTLSMPMSARAILAGQEGSILDVYGKGEYEFDMFTVKLHTNRGSNKGVTIRYGKNLSDIRNEVDGGETYNAIVPYWKGEDGTLVTVTGYVVARSGYTAETCVPMDFTNDFESQPSEADLLAKAQAYLANNEPWVPKDNITVDFVQLWQTPEYANVAVLQRVALCDTVAIYYPALGVTNANAKVIKVVYDVLRERYSSMELGDPQTTLAQALFQPYENTLASVKDKASVSYMDIAINAATQLITGGLGGHVIISQNADGEPEEILIMDTDDKATAVNVWRFNLNGLGHSHSGYNGPFNDIALTMDGKINATMITTGALNADLITAGVLQSANGHFTLNLTTGVLTVTEGATINGTLTTLNNNNGKTVVGNGVVTVYDNNNALGYFYAEQGGGRLALSNDNDSANILLDGQGTILANNSIGDTLTLGGGQNLVLCEDSNSVQKVSINTYGDATFARDLTVGGAVAGQGFFDLLLGIGNAIESNTDLDDIKTEGKYTCPTLVVAGTLSNTPYPANAFGMFVFRVAEGQRLIQAVMPNSTSISIKFRQYNGSNWTAWKTLTPS